MRRPTSLSGNLEILLDPAEDEFHRDSSQNQAHDADKGSQPCLFEHPLQPVKKADSDSWEAERQLQQERKEILIAVDGSDQSFETVRYLGHVPCGDRTKVTLRHARNPGLLAHLQNQKENAGPQQEIQKECPDQGPIKSEILQDPSLLSQRWQRPAPATRLPKTTLSHDT